MASFQFLQHGSDEPLHTRSRDATKSSCVELQPSIPRHVQVLPPVMAAPAEEVRLVPKSLVDVALGALAFYCQLDRRAMPLTHTLAALSVYVTAWAALAALAVATPRLLGGTAADRFGELAPVIVLSSPALWTALRHASVLLDMFDTSLAVAARAAAAFAALPGLWREPQALRRSYILNARVRTRYDPPAPAAAAPGDLCTVAREIRVSKWTRDRDCHAAPHLFAAVSDGGGAGGEEDGGGGYGGDSGSEFVDVISMRWTTEVLPQAARVGLAPRHRSVVFFVEERARQRHPDGFAESRAQRASGTVSAAHYSWRRVFMYGRLIASRTPFEAALEGYTLRVDNVARGWAGVGSGGGVGSAAAAAGPLKTLELVVRRAALEWPATIIWLVQVVVGAILALVDVTIGEAGAFVLVLLLELPHPLPMRRLYAQDALRGKAVVVDDIRRRQDIRRTMGMDRYLVCASGAAFMQSLAATLGGRPDLLRHAAVMLAVGWTWEVHPAEESINFANDWMRLFGSARERRGVLPELRPSSFSMLPPSTRGSVEQQQQQHSPQAAATMVKNITLGLQPMIVLTPAVVALADARGCRSRRLSGLALAGNPLVADALAVAGADFALNWFVGLIKFDAGNYFDAATGADVVANDRAALSAMLEISADCHALLGAHQSCRRRAWSSSPRVDRIRHYRNLDALVAEIDRVEQHDLLASCHRRVAAAAAWAFLDEVKAGAMHAWQKWCLDEAFFVVEAVWK